MARIDNYNPELHDIYTFSGTPTLPRTNPPGSNSLVQPTGLNANNILFDEKYGFPEIDWSGLHVRERGFISYTWSNIQNSFIQYYNTSRMKPGFGGYECYQTGTCTEEEWSNIEDYNNWNNGLWAMILISPQHLLACKHYVGSNTERYVQFIGKDGTVFPLKRATKVAVFGQSEGEVLGIGTSTSSNPFDPGQDMYIFKLDQKLTDEELQKIRVYPFPKYETVPPNTPIFSQDPNGKLHIWKTVGFRKQDNFTWTQVYPQIYDVPKFIDLTGDIFVGDSGTPQLINISGETCFFSLKWGGDYLRNNNLQALSEYVYNDIGYRIREVDGGYVPPDISDQAIDPKTPLTTYPYLSRFSTTQDSINFTSIGFKPACSLQASELNELQENFFNQQSRTIEMVHNWFGHKLFTQQTDGTTFSGPNGISPSLRVIYGSDPFVSKISTVTPISPTQVIKVTDDNISVSPGWYFVKTTDEISYDTWLQNPLNKRNTVYKWVYSPINFVSGTNPSNYFSLKTFSYQLNGSENKLLLDNTYFEVASNVSGADRFVTKLTTTVEGNLPTTGVTLADPVLYYRDSAGTYYLANGYEIK